MLLTNFKGEDIKVLIFEKSSSLSQSLKNEFVRENIFVDYIVDLKNAMDILFNGYCCFILEINFLSSLEIEIIKTIRNYFKHVPIIVTSNNNELEKIKLIYELGCNDYIKKPFFSYELIQKVKILCKSNQNFLLFTNDCKFNIETRTLYCNNNSVFLSKKEFLFLEQFILNTNRIVTYEELEIYVWEGRITNMNNIRALIKRLRKKLPEESIKIVTGVGYTLGENVKLV